MSNSNLNSSVKWMLSGYMVTQHIESFKELAERSGIKYQTLNAHVKAPEQFRMYEIKALDKILTFRDEDLLTLMRGAGA